MLRFRPGLRRVSLQGPGAAKLSGLEDRRWILRWIFSSVA